MKKILGPEISYIDLLDNAITEKQQRERDAQERGEAKFNRHPLRPSSAGECERALAYQLMEHSGKAKYDIELLEPTMVRLFSLGHAIENHLIWFLKSCDMYEVKYQQQSLGFFDIVAEDKKIQHFVEGSNDLCLINNQHGWKAVVDIKSKKDKFSASHKSSWEELDAKLSAMASVEKFSDSAYWVEDLEAFLKELEDPYFAANFLQLNLYANSSFMKERGIDHGVIMQYNKNDSRLREIRFKPCTKLYEQVEAKFKAAAKAADKGQPEEASRDFVLGSVKCAFCNYKKYCWGEEVNTQKAYFETLPNKYWPRKIEQIDNDQFKQDIADFHALELNKTKNKGLEQRIAKFMLDNKLYKVNIGDNIVYEVKTYKTTISVKRGKV